MNTIRRRIASLEAAAHKDRTPDVWHMPFGQVRACTDDEWFEAVEYFLEHGKLPPSGQGINDFTDTILTYTESAMTRRVCELEGHDRGGERLPQHCPGCKPWYHPATPQPVEDPALPVRDVYRVAGRRDRPYRRSAGG